MSLVAATQIPFSFQLIFIKLYLQDIVITILHQGPVVQN